MNYKKPAFWIIVLSVVICIVLALCFLTSPKTNKSAADFDIKRDRTPDAEFAVIADPALPKISVKIAWDGFEHDRVEVHKNGKTAASFNTDGVVQKAFFYDITADGKPDLILNIEKALGQISKTINVFDIADPDNIKQYKLEHRFAFDYSLDTKQGIPTVDITPKKSTELYDSGKLVLKQGKLFIDNGHLLLSGSEVSDKESLLSRYAKVSQFNMTDTSGQSSQNNNPWFIIPDYYNRMMASLSSDLSHSNTRKMTVNTLNYIKAEELDSYSTMIALSSIEDGVIMSDSEQFAAFEVTYYISDRFDDPEMNAGAQYPSGNYMSVFVLGKKEKSDNWEVIRFTVPIGAKDN